MWKLLKALPKTWRHKTYSPLGSNPCSDESSESESRTIDGIPDLSVCNTRPKEEASVLNIDDRKCGIGLNDEASAVSPSRSRCIYVWWFNKNVHLPTSQHECPVRNFIQAFCVGVNSLLEKKRGLSASCGKLNHHLKEKTPGLSLSLVHLAFARPSLDVSHSVLPNQHVDVPSETSLSDTTQTSSISQQSNESSSALPSTSFQQPANDEILSQLKDIAADYTSHILNVDAKQLIKQKHYGRALEMFNSASELGSAEAKYNLGVCYESGIGMEKNINKALRYFKDAASQGHSGALYNLAIFNLEGRGVPINEKTGVEYMVKASESGIKEAHTFLGVHCGQHGEYEKAVQLFQKAAEQSDPDGEYYLGMCYEHGVGVEENIKKALDLYKKSSAAGNAEACYILGTYYEEGLRGVHKDKKSALHLYQKAAGNGHPLARERLNWISQEDSEEDSIVFEDVTSSPSIKPQESTLRMTKSSPELTTQYHDGSSNPNPNLPNNFPQIDFSLVKKFIEQWNHRIGLPEKTAIENNDHSSFEKYSGLSQSLTKLSTESTSLFWDTTPKSSLVTLR